MLQSLTNSYNTHRVIILIHFLKYLCLKKRKIIIIIKALSLILEFFLSSTCFLKEIVYKIDLNYDELVSKIK